MMCFRRQWPFAEQVLPWMNQQHVMGRTDRFPMRFPNHQVNRDYTTWMSKEHIKSQNV